jgi:hypothetical protein
MSRDEYDADYFLRGVQTGKSLYEDYRWMPELTVPMAQAIVKHLGIDKDDKVLDFGCARGYVVRALRELGYNAFGHDVSEWALANADQSVASYLSNGAVDTNTYDWIIAKDVLEHVEWVSYTAHQLMQVAQKGILVVVPLSAHDGNPYVIGDMERDVTHKQRLTLGTWAQMFYHPHWSVEAAYHLPGVKDNWYRPSYERGNGFLTCRRIIQS